MAARNMLLPVIALVLFVAGLVSSVPLHITNSSTTPRNDTSFFPAGNNTVQDSNTTLRTTGNGTAFSLFHGRSASGIRVVISILDAKVQQASTLLKQRYTFISAKQYLEGPLITMGLVRHDFVGCTKKTVTERFQLLFRQFYAFASPLNLACDYEAVPLGSKNDGLSKGLNLTRVYLYDTIRELRRVLIKRQASIPTLTKVSESYLNSTTKDYLTILHNHNQGVPPTDTNVKIYRNYVILYALSVAITDINMYTCIP